MQPRSADSSPAGADLVCRYLPDSTLIYVNEAYCNFFGRSRESLIGRRFIDLIPRSLHSAARAHVEQLCRERNTLMSEHPVVSGSAGVRWQEWVDSVVSAPGSSELVLQGRGRDVTVRHASSTPRGGEKFFRGGVWVLADSGLEPGSTQDLPWVLRQLLGIPGPMAEREINQWLAQVGRLMTLANWLLP